MNLHVLYRTTGGENNKPRPAGYSKAGALRSFCSSLNQVTNRGDIVFVVDGPIPTDGVNQLRAHGEVIQLAGVGNAGSYRHVLRLVHEREWPDDDLVYVAEDDYFYLPEALPRVVAAAERIDRAAFITPYDHPDYYEHPSAVRFDRHHPRSRWYVGGIEWRAVRSTTMTFGARVGALRRATWLHVLGSRGNYPHDFDIWSASQTWLYRGRIARSVAYRRASDPVPGPSSSLSDRVRALTLDPRRALLVAPQAPLAAHMETGLMPNGIDWSAVAASV